MSGGGRGHPFVNQQAQLLVEQPPTAVASSSMAPLIRRPLSNLSSSFISDIERTISLTSQALAAQTAQRPPPAISTQVKAVRPRRLGRGTVGQKCLVRANHFPVRIIAKDLHHYDVTITPEVSSKKVCRHIVNALVVSSRESQLGGRYPAYDGRKSFYTAGPLPFTSKEFVVKLNDIYNSSRGGEFKVAIKFTAKVEMYHPWQLDMHQETIQAIDVVLRSAQSDCYTVVGRSFFGPKLGGGSLGDGLDYWKGFYQSLRFTQTGPSLNVDTSARAFYAPILVSEFIRESLDIRDLSKPLSDQDRIKVKRSLKGIMVEPTHRRYDTRRYKVSGISAQPISELSFPSDGTKIHVVQYFQERYGIHLKFLALPALQAGSDTKPLYLPMELCKIVEGQRYSKNLNEKQVTALLRETCQRPADRETSIKKIVDSNSYGKVACVNDFGLQVGTELSCIEARVLPPPTLQYHKGKLETPAAGGCWNMNNKRMFDGGRVEHWTCVSFARILRKDVVRFCEELVNMCIEKGMKFNQTPLIPITIAEANQIERTLIGISTYSNSCLASMGIIKKQIDMLIVILPDFTGSYGKIKRICETELGIISQCCQPKQAIKCNKHYLENVSLKINVKAGGSNTVLYDAIQKSIPYVTDRPTIIFGADVTHPQPGDDSSPSISAVVASMNWPEITKYRAVVSSQRHRAEIIHDLFIAGDPEKKIPEGGMIRELLLAFTRSTGKKPQRIIFYRDGVSEGQFSQVILHEIDAIKKACLSLEENYRPLLTFVVVQKRHHTRLFPANHGDRSSTDRSGNILPGTVVDSGICHPNEFDFYLCSHIGFKGTSRPTHYHVLYDESRFASDGLQNLTNNLCYTNARCTRSLSIVPPVHYAHLAASRARHYIEKGDTSESAPGTAGGRASSMMKATLQMALNLLPFRGPPCTEVGTLDGALSAAGGRGVTREKTDAVRARYCMKEDTSDDDSCPPFAAGGREVTREKTDAVRASDDDSCAAGGRGVTREKTDAVRPLPVIIENVRDVMFYC